MQGGYRFPGRVGSSPTELGLQVEVVDCDSELTALQCSCVIEREAPSTRLLPLIFPCIIQVVFAQFWSLWAALHFSFFPLRALKEDL